MRGQLIDTRSFYRYRLAADSTIKADVVQLWAS